MVICVESQGGGGEWVKWLFSQISRTIGEGQVIAESVIPLYEHGDLYRVSHLPVDRVRLT